MFSHILVAYDGSELAKKTLKKAEQLVLENRAKLEVLFVLHTPVIVIGDGVFPSPEATLERYEQHYKRVMDEVNAELTDFRDAKISIAEGNPARVILNYADEIGADLIMIGSRGLTGFNEMVLGSVSHNVVQHSKIPVLVVK